MFSSKWRQVVIINKAQNTIELKFILGSVIESIVWIVNVDLKLTPSRMRIKNDPFFFLQEQWLNAI